MMMTFGGRCAAANAVQKFACSALTINTPASSQRLAVRCLEFAKATVKCERMMMALSSVVESCLSICVPSDCWCACPGHHLPGQLHLDQFLRRDRISLRL